LKLFRKCLERKKFGGEEKLFSFELQKMLLPMK